MGVLVLRYARTHSLQKTLLTHPQAMNEWASSQSPVQFSHLNLSSPFWVVMFPRLRLVDQYPVEVVVGAHPSLFNATTY